MNSSKATILFIRKVARLSVVIISGVTLLIVYIVAMRSNAQNVNAARIDPPEGYPKFILSTMSVNPTLANTGGVTLDYIIKIRNTGAYAGINTTLLDAIPEGTTYNNDANSNRGGKFTFAKRVLGWVGNVGFDSTVTIKFSVDVDTGYEGTVHNKAEISHPLISQPVSVTAETVVTDQPFLEITKRSEPTLPGANKPLTYTIIVANQGQPAHSLPITVTDFVPLNTTVSDVGEGKTDGSKVTWTRQVSLELGESTEFTFTVDVGNVSSGTVIVNDDYQVASSVSGVTTGEDYKVTVVDPDLFLSKYTTPDPPGSNREMTYTLVLLNKGSLATDLEITDQVPQGVSYVRGGTLSGDIVSWNLPKLDTNESGYFTYTVFIDDVMDVPIVNDNYAVCSAEGTCQDGDVITNVVGGPEFELSVELDPIAKKPGGGGGPVTPTLVVRNLGPGNAKNADVVLEFDRISVQASDLYEDPGVGIPPLFLEGPECGEKCVSYLWSGSINYADSVTFTTDVGQSTIGGEEGQVYSATIMIIDSVGNKETEPITETAYGKITHLANLIPIKSAPAVIGQGQLMTYTINVWNSALSTDELATPVLSDTLPMNVKLNKISDGGTSSDSDGKTIVSWTLPAMSTGSTLQRSFTVRVDDDLVSGTQIINADYGTSWYETDDKTAYSNIGQPVTTTVKEVGLIDSYKEVDPAIALPGPNVILTYTLHIVNSSAVPLVNVDVYDYAPWEHSTYQRDAAASSGTINSDIVSIQWSGNVAALSSETVTFTVVVDPYYKGALTNTAVITHPDLLNDVVVEAVAHVTDEPVLKITKSATPNKVRPGEELFYQIQVENLGQQATNLVIVDTIPSNTKFVENSGSSGAKLKNGQIQWEIPVLEPGHKRMFEFRVLVGAGDKIVNETYMVTCAEGVVGIGRPLITQIIKQQLFMPIVMR
ncbi:MAG: DUF11 domain-containing protein [Anaerolineales bacterium]|nr:DUF11 domain-containing protein [Anaerolineales bacterium]